MPNIGKDKAREYEYDAAGVRLTVMTGVILMLNDAVTNLSADAFHTHSWYEMFCAVKGSICVHFENNEMCVLSPGEAIIIPPDKYHYAVFSDAQDKPYAFAFSIQYTQRSSTAETLKKLLRTDTYQYFRSNETYSHLMRFLSEALSKHQGVLCGTYLLSLLLNAAECCTLPNAVPSENPADNRASRIYKIEQAIFTHYSGRLPIKLLAEELHLSERQVSRIIHQHYGTSYRSKNKDLRMQSAARKLQKGECISQVAASEGYSSLSAFYTAFRKTYGMTPAEYQKQNRKD